MPRQGTCPSRQKPQGTSPPKAEAPRNQPARKTDARNRRLRRTRKPDKLKTARKEEPPKLKTAPNAEAYKLRTSTAANRRIGGMKSVKSDARPLTDRTEQRAETDPAHAVLLRMPSIGGMTWIRSSKKLLHERGIQRSCARVSSDESSQASSQARLLSFRETLSDSWAPRDRITFLNATHTVAPYLDQRGSVFCSTEGHRSFDSRLCSSPQLLACRIRTRTCRYLTQSLNMLKRSQPRAPALIIHDLKNALTLLLKNRRRSRTNRAARLTPPQFRLPANAAGDLPPRDQRDGPVKCGRRRAGTRTVRIGEGDVRARDRMVRANLRLVVNIARGYTGKGLSLPGL